MKAKNASPDRQDNSDASENQAPDPQLLSTLAEEMEKDENVEKLAKQLSKELTKSNKDSLTPDLPFSKFLDKLKKSKGQ